MWLLILPVLASLLMAAHVLFHGMGLAAAVGVLVLIVLVFVRHRAMQWFLTALFAVYALEWVRTTIALVAERQSQGRPAALACAILLACAVFSAAAALALHARPLRAWFARTRN
ncbi:MAG: hypothetical protein Q3X95_01025 [Duodenibacillus sp.]|nr:hypothetical protein [Duodenibacillus sp.]